MSVRSFISCQVFALPPETLTHDNKRLSGLTRAGKSLETGGDGVHCGVNRAGSSRSGSKYLRSGSLAGMEKLSGGSHSGIRSSGRLGGRGATIGYAKPQRTVRLLKEAPCYLPPCPAWIKAPSLWSPRLSLRQVDIRTLGWGRHGSQVLLVRQLSNGNTAVMKQFAREKLLASPRLHDKVLNEWRVHSAVVPHPNIVPLYGAVEDKSYVTIVMEAQRGDLLWYLDQADREVLSEDEARSVAADVLTALAHMHDMGFVHRDVKAENVFAEPVSPIIAAGTTAASRRGGATAGGGASAASASASRRGGDGAAAAGRSYSPPPCSCWRLGDMGSAVEVEAVMRPSAWALGLNLEGSPPFLAPEYAALWLAPPASRTTRQLQRATSPKQDIWALGALVYDILVGHPPFSGRELDASGGGAAAAEPPLPQLVAAILTRPPSPPPAATGLSASAVDFIETALRKAPEERPTAAELLSHPWLSAPPSLPVDEGADDRRGGASAACGSTAAASPRLAAASSNVDDGGRWVVLLPTATAAAATAAAAAELQAVTHGSLTSATMGGGGGGGPGYRNAPPGTTPTSTSTRVAVAAVAAAGAGSATLQQTAPAATAAVAAAAAVPEPSASAAATSAALRLSAEAAAQAAVTAEAEKTAPTAAAAAAAASEEASAASVCGGPTLALLACAPVSPSTSTLKAGAAKPSLVSPSSSSSSSCCPTSSAAAAAAAAAFSPSAAAAAAASEAAVKEPTSAAAAASAPTTALEKKRRGGRGHHHQHQQPAAAAAAAAADAEAATSAPVFSTTTATAPAATGTTISGGSGDPSMIPSASQVPGPVPVPGPGPGPVDSGGRRRGRPRGAVTTNKKLKEAAAAEAATTAAAAAPLAGGAPPMAAAGGDASAILLLPPTPSGAQSRKGRRSRGPAAAEPAIADPQPADVGVRAGAPPHREGSGVPPGKFK